MASEQSSSPAHAGWVLTALILGAGVANMNLSVANVALPDIGRDLNASQNSLNFVAVGFSLGLAGTVLYLGALGDRYGRKLMLLAGLALGIPAAFLSAFAPNVEVLALSRVLGGMMAGMAYPTTLALITALWTGAARTRAIALWSALGAAMSASSTLLAGAVLLWFSWGYSFLIAVPFALVAVVLVWRLVPGKVNESDEPVDHLGGVLSAVFIGALVLGIHNIGMPSQRVEGLWMFALATVAGVAFFWRQRVASNPLFDLRYAARPTFWAAAVSGIIVFGSLMAAIFVGQQFLQNVLGYNSFEAGLAIIPCALAMVVAAPFSSGLIARYGSRGTLLLGFAVCMVGFISMWALWNITTSVWIVVLSYVLIGVGVGFAGTPASHALTDSVPVTKVGMASGTGDLQRDLGGSVMQSLLGAILSAGYAAAIAAAIAKAPADLQQELGAGMGEAIQNSFGSAVDLAAKYPQYASDIIAAAKQSFLQGSEWAYLAGIASMAVGIVIVASFFPRKERESALYAEYAAENSAVSSAPVTPAP
jgi:DHA2 family multidrug resistance protein-like MFS transporter